MNTDTSTNIPSDSSEGVLQEEDKSFHGRFKDALWYDPSYSDIVIGGAGGIGSWLSFLLARIGFDITIYDYDDIDSTNMAGQLYSVDSIGENKAEAMVDIIAQFSDNFNVEAAGRFDPSDSFVTPVVFACFDNMEARRQLFECWRQGKYQEGIFIDGRMTAESFQVFCVDPNNKNSILDYQENYLFSDDEVDDLPCSFKATSHTGAMIASYMVSCFTNFIVNIKQGENIREVPFKTEYNIPLLMLEQEQCKNPLDDPKLVK